MPAPADYAPYALIFGTTSIPFYGDSLQVAPELNQEALKSGAQLQAQEYVDELNIPMIKVDISKPDSLTLVGGLADAIPFGSGKTVTAVKAVWRQLAEGAGWANAYWSCAFAGGLILPQRMRFDARKGMVLSLEILAAYSGGVAMVIGSDSAARATPVSYRLNSIVLGGATVVNPSSFNANWKWERKETPNTPYPTEYWTKGLELAADFKAADISTADADRLNGEELTLVVNSIDKKTPANTVATDFGTGEANAEIGAEGLTLNWKAIEAA